LRKERIKEKKEERKGTRRDRGSGMTSYRV